MDLLGILGSAARGVSASEEYKKQQQQLATKNLLAGEEARQKLLKDYQISEKQPMRKSQSKIKSYAYLSRDGKNILRFTPKEINAGELSKYKKITRLPEKDIYDEATEEAAPGWVKGETISSFIPNTYVKPRNKQLEMWQELLNDPQYAASVVKLQKMLAPSNNGVSTGEEQW
jgi:hypothetical protein